MRTRGATVADPITMTVTITPIFDLFAIETLTTRALGNVQTKSGFLRVFVYYLEACMGKTDKQKNKKLTDKQDP